MIAVVVGILNLITVLYKSQIRSGNHARQDLYMRQYDYNIRSTLLIKKTRLPYAFCFTSYCQRRGVNLKSRNFWILCCDNVPFANIRALHVLHLSIIRLVFVGLSVAIALQKRQCTIRSHDSRTVNLLILYCHRELYIVPRKFRLRVWLVRQFYDHERSPSLPTNNVDNG